MKRVLVLCTGNSCRSQMAEGWINQRLAGRWQARSAGMHPAKRVHPLAVRAMAEVGVDLARSRPKPIAELLDQPWDLVVTVCDQASELCPRFPRALEQLHVGFLDPARAEGSDDERMRVCRRVRDEIKDQLLPLLEVRGGAG